MHLSTRKWAIVAVATQTALLVLADCAQCDVTGDLGALPVVAEAWRANIAKIETWRGRVRSASERIEHGKSVGRNAVSIEFFLRARSEQLCQLRTYDVAHGKELKEKTVLNSLVSDGKLAYRMTSQEPNGGIWRSEVQIKPFKGKLSMRSPTYVWNPMHYFGPHGASVADTFMLYFESAKDPKLLGDWVVARNKNIVEVTNSKGDRHDVYTVDLDKGGNLMRFAMTSDAAATIFEYEFERRDGIWVPSFHKYQNRIRFVVEDGVKKVTPEEQSSTIETVEWLDSELNEDLPDSDFTLAKLGVKNGDLIHDQLTDTYYNHIEKKPPELAITDARGVSKTVRLADFHGKWVVLEFWRLDCQPCIQETLPKLSKFYDGHQADGDRFEILAVCKKWDDNARTIEEYDRQVASIAEKFWDGKPLPFPVLIDGDGKTFDDYGVHGVPQSFLIDPDGNLVKGGDEDLLAEKLMQMKQ